MIPQLWGLDLMIEDLYHNSSKSRQGHYRINPLMQVQAAESRASGTSMKCRSVIIGRASTVLKPKSKRRAFDKQRITPPRCQIWIVLWGLESYPVRSLTMN